MEVYVIPIGRDRYELYCETQSPMEETDTDNTGHGWVATLRERFSVMVREAEDRDTKNPSAEERNATWWQKVQMRLLAWVAERIAEQRLLWSLRRVTAARLIHPSDMPFEGAFSTMQGILKRDHDRHRVWLVVNGVLLLVSAVLAIVPGPNIVAYYFAFRVVGHWLSMRGAAQGLSHVTWHGESSARLADLRAVVGSRVRSRMPKVQAIAEDLGLAKLAAFVERVSPR